MKAGKETYPIAYEHWGKLQATTYCKGIGFADGFGYNIDETTSTKPKLTMKCQDPKDIFTCGLVADPPSPTPYQLAAVLCLNDICKWLSYG
jgi:hypothetical protein